MARWRADTIGVGTDGLTEAILPEAEIAASPRLDWRMALENMVGELKSLR